AWIPPGFQRLETGAEPMRPRNAAVVAALAVGILVGRAADPPRSRAGQEPAKPGAENPYATMLHVGILGHDLDRAVEKWRAMGFTDIVVLPPSKGIDRTFHGQPLDCALRQAFIRGTTPQIELLQPVDAVPNPWSSVLAEKGEVIHHLAYRVSDSP